MDKKIRYSLFDNENQVFTESLWKSNSINNNKNVIKTIAEMLKKFWGN
jgi:hypothetical protein